ncbi:MULTISPECIES: hypothetical protein [Burkholderiaceae]|nr:MULTISPECIES: hypothetical protein [Burkholderiaceae]
MAKALPEFAPLSLKELRSLWKKYRGNEDIERLVLEVQFSRGVINEVDSYFKSIHQAWRQENLGELVALEKLRLLLVKQHLRQTVLAEIKPAPKGTKPSEPPEPEPALVD